MPQKTVLIYAGDDFERLAELRREVDIAERAAEDAAARPHRLGDDDASAELVAAARKAFDDFVDYAAERAEEWIVHSIGHEEFRDLLANHPPRQVADAEGKQVDHAEDASWGFNTTTLPKALLLYADPEDAEHRTVTKAGDIDLGGLARRVRRLSAGEFESLWATAYMLNRGGLRDPKEQKFSTATSRPDET